MAEQILKTLLIFMHLVVALSIRLEEAKEDSCNEEIKITALQEDKEQPGILMIFSGNNVFECDINTFTLIKAQRISEKFENVTGPIDACLYSPSLQGYVFAKKDSFIIHKSTTGQSTKFSFRDYGDLLQKFYGTRELKRFRCAAVFDDSAGQPVSVVMICEGRSFCCEFGLGHCKELTKEIIPNPNGLDKELFKDRLCEGLSIEKAENESYKWRLIVADDYQMRMWHDTTLVDQIVLKKLFGCSSAINVLIACMVTFTILVTVTVTVTVAILIVFRSRRDHFDQDTFHH